MKTSLLLLVAIVGTTFASCEKEKEPFYPNQKTGTWFIKIEGNFLDSFHVVMYEPRPPYAEVHYTTRLGGGNDLLKIDIEPGQWYGIKYMDIDSTMKLIQHNPEKVMNIYDTIPATMW